MRILLLTLSLLFTQELEVQGDLKVSGNIDAQNNPIKNVGTPTDMNDAVNAQILQDALRDDGVYEYKSIILRINIYDIYSNNNPNQYRAFKELDQDGSFENNISFDTYISELSNQEYQLFNISSPMTRSDYSYLIYSFRKPIEE